MRKFATGTSTSGAGSSQSGLRRFVTSPGGGPDTTGIGPGRNPGTAGTSPGTTGTSPGTTGSGPGTVGSGPGDRPGSADSAPGAASNSGAAVGLAEATDPRAMLAAVTGGAIDLNGQPDEIEKCELCATVIPAAHGHLADLENSSLMCACRACYLLFTRPEAGRGRYRTVPDRVLSDPAHPVSVFEWDALEIPVGLAFFLRDSRTGDVTGFYPSPAGATECRLDLQAWNELAGEHPLLNAAEPDVEAILITREDSTVDCFVVPIDACYELAGRMRLYWRGFDGGSEAKASIAEFLGNVRARARTFDRET